MLCGLLAWAFGSFGVGFASAGRSGDVRTTRCAQSTDAEGPVPALRFLGDPDLMQPQPEVSEEVQGAEFQSRLKILKEAMSKYGGIGIAAPQIGWWVRAMCFGIEDGNPRYPAAPPVSFQYWINPEITWFSEETSWMWEGCLSVPGLRGWVERPREIRMKGLNEHGESVEVHFKGLAARIAQHEFDHLDGVLFPFRVESAKLLVPNSVFDGKEQWQSDWPTPGSFRTKAGDLSLQK
ncbi:unnamed protein product [Cladocopium goreaui]|uniref:Peptide deformylase n=1 Tax=Cladocopium goreaui TaxID=2562237 RepID=A0A9P1CAQ0_9DINO|nr:unnamed protein product [Cladocopium goreaui]